MTTLTEPITLAVVTPEERAAREREGASLVQFAQTLVIQTSEQFRSAAKWLQEVVGPMKRTITETFRPRIEQAHALHKGLLADEKRFLAPVEDAERQVRGKLAAWEQEQARLARESEQAAQRERERLEREGRAEAEAAQHRLQAEAETRRLEEAAQLEAAGDREGAERLIQTPVPVATVTPPPVFAPRPVVVAAPKVEGVSFRDDWTFEIVNAAQIPAAYLMPDEKKIGGVVRAMRGSTSIPGVRVFSRRVSSVRSA